MAQNTAAPTVIRSSMKPIQAAFALVIVLVITAVWVHYQYLVPQGQPPWAPAVVALLFFWPVSKTLKWLFHKITISGEKLIFETGALSKQTRIIQIPKIQDVRVLQSVGQRLLGTGDLAIETAGESSRLTIANVDSPRALAEQLLELSSSHPGTAGQAGGLH